jgi:hypothetical protein
MTELNESKRLAKNQAASFKVKDVMSSAHLAVKVTQST